MMKSRQNGYVFKLFKSRRITRKKRRLLIVVFAALIMSTIWSLISQKLSDFQQHDLLERVDNDLVTNFPRILRNESALKRNSIKAITTTAKVPLDHIGYLSQNGLIMIKRTREMQQKTINIVFDSTLRKDFRNLQNQCQKNPECRFSFKNINNIDGRKVDGVVTAQTAGIIVDNAALHFTKTVYLPQFSGHLQNKEWWGTDIYAGYQNMESSVEPDSFFSAPMHLPVFKTEETYESLHSSVNLNSKVNMVTILCHARHCIGLTSIANIIARQLEARWPIKIFSQSCDNSTNATPLDSLCQSNVECFVRYSRSIIIYEPSDDDSMIVHYFWKAMAHSTAVVYFWNSSFEKYAPPLVSFKIESESLSVEGIDFLENVMQTDILASRFSWKKQPITNTTEYVLRHTKSNMPCNLCLHIALRKKSTKCMIDSFSSQQAPIIEKSSMLRNIESTAVMHYSNATSRKVGMELRMREWQLNGTFIEKYDKELIGDELNNCIMASHNHSFVYRKVWDFPAKMGEISLTVKNFWVYYSLLLNGAENTLILEDDAELNEETHLSAIDEIMDQVPPNYSMVQLGISVLRRKLQS